ncbi:MAG: diguanylate cyclase (GGDEF)-like protein [Kangiellaceae bacterium]|jgi:diguanylate cyclase (GGDEF)-like protein
MNSSEQRSTGDNKEKRPAFWRVIMRIAIVAGITDIAFFFLFHILGSPILAWVNIGSVIMYASAYYAIKNRNQKLAVRLMWSEVMIHAALSIILIGWESGFHYYLLMFIPAICLSTQRKPAVMTLSSLFVFYIGLNLLRWFVDPLQPINPFALNVVHIFNLSVVFLMFSYLSFYYLHTVTRAQKKLRTLATTDPLASLFNRRHISYLTEREIQRNNRTKQGISVLIIDIDYFKRINDDYGHKSGDEVLTNTAHRLKRELRKQDLIARWGGEEFSVVLPDSGAEDATKNAERIRTAFYEYDWANVLKDNVHITVSVGVSQFSETENLGTALARADRALYKGKSLGRNKVVFEAG